MILVIILKCTIVIDVINKGSLKNILQLSKSYFSS